MLLKKGEMLNEKQITFIFLPLILFFSLALFIISSPLKKKKKP